MLQSEGFVEKNANLSSSHISLKKSLSVWKKIK